MAFPLPSPPPRDSLPPQLSNSKSFFLSFFRRQTSKSKTSQNKRKAIKSTRNKHKIHKKT